MPIRLVRVIPSLESLDCTSHGRSRPLRKGQLAMASWQCRSEVIDTSHVVLKGVVAINHVTVCVDIRNHIPLKHDVFLMNFFFQYYAGFDIKHLVYIHIGHVVLKVDVPCKTFHLPSQYLYKPCTAYVYCWENKYRPWLKKSLGQMGT